MNHQLYMGNGGGNILHYACPHEPVKRYEPFYYPASPCAVVPVLAMDAAPPEYVSPPPPDACLPLPLGAIAILPPSPLVAPPPPPPGYASVRVDAPYAAASLSSFGAVTASSERESKQLTLSGTISDFGISSDGSLQMSDVLMSDLLRDIDGSATEDGDSRNNSATAAPATPPTAISCAHAMSAMSTPPRSAAEDASNSILRIIMSLRAEMTDDAVRSRVRRLPHHTCTQLVAALRDIPQVMMGLCLKSRGNILVHLVERLGGDAAAPLVAFTLEHLRYLAVDRNGCIALPRMMDFATLLQLDKFFTVMLVHARELAVDPYGNYVVKYFVMTTHRDRYVPTLLREYLIPHLVEAATNKFGSHVLESTIKRGGLEALLAISGALFDNSEALRICSHDQFANYCVQSCLRNLRTLDPGMFQRCAVHVLRVLAGSPYEKNIVKQLGRHLAKFTALAKCTC